MSAEDDIADALTRHQIFVLRYARGREREAEDFVSRTLLSVISRLEEDDLTTLSRERYQEKARDLYQYLRASNSDYADEFLDEMRRFAGYESDFNTSLGQKHLDVDFNQPSPIQLQQAVFADIMGLEPTQGYTIRGMLDQYGRQGANLVVDQIRESITLGETTQQLTSKIRSLIPTQQRKAATVARTAVNHVAVQARKESMKENDDVLDGYKWLATLDSRTSMICMARDGTIYRDYDKDPKPPAHFNCRSTITYIVKPEFDIGADIVGTRPAKGSGGTKQVSAELTYDQWLRKQPEGFQDRVLGKTRAKIFRKGLTLDRFVDNRGNMLTLEQLSRDDSQFVFETDITPQISGIDRVRFDDINQAKNLSAEELSQFLDDTLSDDLKKLVLRVRRPDKIIDNGRGQAWYNSRGRVLNQKISKDVGTDLVFAHEYGHHIDFEFGDIKYTGFSERSPAFKQAFLDDRKDLGLKATKTKLDAMRQLSAELFETTTKERKYGGTYQVRKPKADWCTMASDIVDAMTAGQFYKQGHWGHGTGYYKRKGSKELETFANLFAIRGNPEGWAWCQRRFPKLSARFDRIIREYLESGANTYDG
jgi:SPP1 gp7 family putative phage head morphogenesis protein